MENLLAEKAETETINAEIDQIILRKEGTDWSILSVTVESGKQAKVVGITHAAEGMAIRAEGRWEDTKYGRQFTANHIHVCEPTSPEGIARYLGSGMIKGIGNKLAKSIVEQFGEETLTILDKNPGRILEVHGIGKAKAEKIIKSWVEQRSVSEIMLFLAEYHVSPSLARRIYNKYKADSVRIVRTMPYRLATEIDGVGFRIADRVARQIGTPFDSAERIEAALIYVLRESRLAGHCGLYYQVLVNQAQDAMTCDDGVVSKELIQSTLDAMTAGANPMLTLVRDEGQQIVYLTWMWEMEQAVASTMTSLSQLPASWSGRAKEAALIGETKEGLTLGDAQRRAMISMLSYSFSVMTGGPGTGKTSTLRALLSAFDYLGVKYDLAAPTGKAAKRMEEATGRKSQTIHRLLNLGGEDPLTTIPNEILVLDESSMIDLELMHTVAEAVRGKSLILVGDVDQLPSVGPGQVLRDVIESHVVPVSRLDKTYRQSEHSKISVNASLINNGQMPLPQNRNDDFLFVNIGQDDESPGEIAVRIAEWITDVVAVRLPKTYGYDPLKDIMVLSPMRKHDVGVYRLNQLLQERLNPNPAAFRMRGETRLGVGDKVMQTRNNYDLKIFNGDIGFIRQIDESDEKFVIDFDDRIVLVPFGDASDLELAYAMTIHKSQGSEAKAVVIPMSTQHYNMLNRNLLYTGVTRAKGLLVLAGQQRALKRAIQNKDDSHRVTMLRVLMIRENGGERRLPGSAVVIEGELVDCIH